MPVTQRAARDARRLRRTLAASHRSTGQAAALAQAAGTVIAKRTALGLAAIADPWRADHAELARIVPEKAIAFSHSATIIMQFSGDLAQRITRFAMNESMLATRAAGELAGCRDVAAVAALQNRFAMAWFSRAVSHTIAVASLMTQAQAASMAPVHRAATRNSRRLK